MTLLVDRALLSQRALVAGRELAPLTGALESELDDVVARELFVPPEKARLTRRGGRCERDGTLLDFDPFSPHEHRCPRCGARYTGEEHYRFWIYWYQLWLVERAVHGALLGAFGRRPSYGRFAISVVERFTDAYLDYPNRDNALGPTRLFFSTYLESIWLLNFCVALDFLEESHVLPPGHSLRQRARDRVIEPSLALVSSFAEGQSNRQVWNNGAIIAASRMLGRDDDVTDAVLGESGVTSHLGESLLPDGTWYEGENYHLFAHRGLWYCAELAKRADVAIPPDLLERLDFGFVTPFLTALPDLTVPARRDSQYAISLRQWRFAEMCEIGLGRVDDETLRSTLGRIYADGPSPDRRRVGRWRSSADVERNEPGGPIGRADLSWRSLLFAVPELPALAEAEPTSVVLEDQGLAIVRRERGRVYVALDYGHSGGGHGHPDRLNLLFADGDARWLDDYGTGSYVDPSLHWYRSTLAHNAPLIDRRSQPRVDGALRFFDEQDRAAYVSAQVRFDERVRARRSLVVMPGYFIDVVDWIADGGIGFDLPIHADLVAPALDHASAAAPLQGGSGEEDGFEFLRETARTAFPENATIALRPREVDALRVWMSTDQPSEWWSAIAPGPPIGVDARFRLLRTYASTGCIRSVWAWSGDVTAAEIDEDIVVEVGRERHVHAEGEDRWAVRIERVDGVEEILLGAEPGELLEDPQGEPADPEERAEQEPDEVLQLSPDDELAISMTEQEYRASEETWAEAGEPSADVVLHWDGSSLEISVEAWNVEPTFVPEGTENPLDNEPAEINGASVQLYLITEDDRRSGWLLVPGPKSSGVRVLPVADWPRQHELATSWSPITGGYAVRALVDLPPGDRADIVVLLDVVVNEKPADRERRRGQLVLSGAEGERVYLRGDRHEISRLIPVRLLHD